MNRVGTAMTGLLVLLMLAAVPVSAAMGGNLGGTGGSSGHTYSGDDAYDPAAGSQPELSVAAATTFSGDDAYDPAAGGTPELSVVG